ncbi:MAG: GDSL-type esterase/lipase family protein [Muribaculaceae bacterium]|nr:GDSL-type esterase/lipase family protein [Muribaculaceae bacterium]
MKRLIITLTALLAILAAQAAAPVRILYIGNSITMGALLKNPDKESAPARASEYVAARTGRHVDMRNCGVNGATTLYFLPVAGTHFNDVMKATRELSADGTGLIISVALGTNDSAQKGPLGAPVVPIQYYTNMQAIITELLTALPSARVVIQYPIWYSPTTYNGAMYLRAGLERLQTYFPMIDRLVQDYAATHPGRVFAGRRDAYAQFENQTDLFIPEQGNAGTFYLHPNPTGADRLGSIWAEAIIAALKD